MGYGPNSGLKRREGARCFLRERVKGSFLEFRSGDEQNLTRGSFAPLGQGEII